MLERFQFIDFYGNVRTVWTRGASLDVATQAEVWFDGGDVSDGRAILGSVPLAHPRTLICALDGLPGQGWQLPWNHGSGIPADTDTRCLHMLPDVIRDRAPGVGGVFAGGHSGGGGIEQEYMRWARAELGEGSRFAAHGISKRPLHESAVDADGFLVAREIPPIVWLFATHDPKYTPVPPPEHLSQEESRAAYERTLGAQPLAPTSVSCCGKPFARTTYNRPLIVLEQTRGAHEFDLGCATCSIPKLLRQGWAELAGYVQ